MRHLHYIAMSDLSRANAAEIKDCVKTFIFCLLSFAGGCGIFSILSN